MDSAAAAARPHETTAPAAVDHTASREARWYDLCQLGDAMYVPFIEALMARFAHLATDIGRQACVRPGIGLARLDRVHAGSVRADTGLRVLDRVVWRYQGSGVCVLEVIDGAQLLLIYEPGAHAVRRRSTGQTSEIRETKES